MAAASMNTITLELDISKRGTGGCVKVGQGDEHGTTIKALIYDNGSELDLTGCTVHMVARLPDKVHYWRGQCSVSGNAATCVCDEDKLCSVSGYTDEAYFTIEKDGSTYSTERFAIDIVRSAMDGQKPAESWDSAVEALEKRAETAVSKSEKAASDAAAALENANAAAKACASVTDAANTAASNANSAAGSANAAASSANTAKANADAATDAAKAATTAANESKNSADEAAADARKAADEARGSVSSDMKIYFKRVTDAQGNSRPVLVDMTV